MTMICNSQIDAHYTHHEIKHIDWKLIKTMTDLFCNGFHLKEMDEKEGKLPELAEISFRLFR